MSAKIPREFYQYPRQVEFLKIPNLSEKIAVTYLIWTLKGGEIIGKFAESSSFLTQHDLNHILIGNYLQFANCPVNSPQDEAVTVAFQLFYTQSFRQILSKSTKESGFIGSVREYYLNPKQQNSIEIKQHLIRIFDLSWNLAGFLENLGNPIGKNIRQIDQIANNFLKDENNSSLRSEDFNFQKEDFKRDFAIKYAENKFIISIYNQIQNEINFLSRELEN
jgi:hypothetical protein